MKEKEMDECLQCIDLQNKLEAKEDELQQLKKEYADLHRINLGVKNKILYKIDEYAARDINPFALDALNDTPIGYEDKEKNQIYCGYKEWLCLNAYYKAVNSSMTEAKLKSKDRGYPMFVKDVAESIIGRELLKASSVKGRACNAKKDSVAKPKIEDSNLLAVKGIFKHYLVKERQLTLMNAELELGSVNAYIASKISDLNKKPGDKTGKKKKGKVNGSKIKKYKDRSKSKKKSKKRNQKDEESGSKSSGSDNNNSNNDTDEKERTSQSSSDSSSDDSDSSGPSDSN